MADVKYTNQISVKDYNYLRKSAQWEELENEQALTGLNNSCL